MGRALPLYFSNDLGNIMQKAPEMDAASCHMIVLAP
jgi:hypothetical protein